MATPAELVDRFSPAEIKAHLREMLFCRHFEEQSMRAFREGKAGGYLHVYSGMEALALGWLKTIRRGHDYLISAYRDHVYALMHGTDPVAVMAEIMGRVGGLSRGKGGSMHLYDRDNLNFGGWGIVGAHTALGGGLALASKYRGDDRVTLCFLGDGAANAGVFFETLNMAGLWQLPIVFVIENNLYAMGTSIERHAADTELYKRGAAFNMRRERLEAWDVFQCFDDARRIVDYVRRERKPYLVEAMCYRLAGHGAADHDRRLYREKSEEEFWASERDPIERLKRYMLEHRLATDEKLEALDAEALEEAERVYAVADASPHPEPGEVYDHVYTDMQPEEGH